MHKDSHRGFLLILLGFLAAPQGVAADDVLRDVRAPEIRDYAVVIGKDAFTKQAIVERAKALLAQRTPRPAVLRLTAGTIVGETSRALFHGKPEGAIYESTIDELKKYGPPRGRLARVIALRGGILLSYRDEKGFSEEVVSGGADPTRFAVGSAQYRLVHFNLVDSGEGARGRYTVAFYFVRPQPLSLGNCAQLLHSLQALVGLQNVDVSVRTRPWFPDVATFPIQYPFQPDLTIPTLGEYLRMASMNCSTISGELSGGGNNIVP